MSSILFTVLIRKLNLGSLDLTCSSQLRKTQQALTAQPFTEPTIIPFSKNLMIKGYTHKIGTVAKIITA